MKISGFGGSRTHASRPGMKPAFALDLDHDSVTLLKRSDTGWLRVASVELSEADLDGALARLRGQAETLEPKGFTTKLVLPPSQILYTEVDAPGPDRATRRATIAEALKGRTPYEVADLAFDFSRHGDRAKVAVVAQMTLAEAEAFAETYGFNPVCFVAAPKDGAFGGEPFFGLTARAGEHVPEGSHLDRDQEPVRVTGDLPAVAVAAPVEAPEPEPVAAEVAEEVVVAEVAAEPEVVVEPVDEVPEPEDIAEAAAEAAEPEVGENPEPAAEEPPPEAEAVTAEETPEPAPAAPVLETVAGRMQAAQQPQEIEEPAAEPVEEAPFIEVEDTDEGEPISVLHEALPDAAAEPAAPSFQTRRAASRPEDEDDLRAAENRLHLMTIDPVPDFPSAQVIEGVAAITAPVLDVPAAPPETEEDGRASRHRAPPIGRPILKSIPDAAHGTMAQQKLRHAGAAPPIVTPPAPAEAARPRAAKPPRTTVLQPGKGSGRVLLALTGILVAAIVVIGVGSAWLSGDKTPVAPATPEATAPASPDASAADPAAADPAAPVEDVVPPSDNADAEPLPDATPPADSADVADDPPPPSESATDAAVTDALAAAPEPDVAPPADVAVTPPAPSPLPEADASGAPVVAQSPAAADGAPSPTLPDAGATASDSPPATQPVPPPFGTLTKFDSAGRIVPTAEGVITPDGYTLFAGPPPKVPPARPATAVAPAAVAPIPATADPAAAAPGDGAALTPEALPPADPALAGKKPRLRPASIAAAAAAAQQKAEAVAEAAAAAAKAEAERLASATPQAVASSRRPAGRPSGLVTTAASTVEATAVDAAVAAAVAEPVVAETPAPVAAPATAPQPEVVAAAPAPAPEPEAAPGTSFSDEVNEPDVQGTPNMPTTRTVAKQATIKNAINLSEVSLIGVYGSSSNRRALIRMPSGRFVKVKVGDRVDGGTIAAIGESEVSYVKRGRTIVLKMSKSG